MNIELIKKIASLAATGLTLVATAIGATQQIKDVKNDIGNNNPQPEVFKKK